MQYLIVKFKSYQISANGDLDCICNKYYILINWQGAQWFSGGVLDMRPKGRGLEPYWRHCVVVLEQETFILA